MTDLDGQPDLPMTPEEESKARSLTQSDLMRIDETLLAEASHQWRKVARLVGWTMRQLDKEFPDLPDVFYASRVKHLAASGKLEAAGNLDRMRFSEVRLPEKQPSAER